MKDWPVLQTRSTEMPTKFHVGDRVEDKETHKRGRVTFVYSELERKGEVIEVLYRVPEIVTRGRFPDGGESDSTWRTQEARHVGSDTIAPGF